MVFNCVFDTFSCGILGQVWYLNVLIPDLCHLSYFIIVISNGMEIKLFMAQFPFLTLDLT